MNKSKSKLYTILFIACFAGYMWLIYNYTNQVFPPTKSGICIIKGVTGIPCPSCGSTRSTVSILNGEFKRALYINPLGYIILTLMTLFPIWISIDIIIKKGTLFTFYKQTEKILRIRWVAICLVILVITNWIWNITKQL